MKLMKNIYRYLFAASLAAVCHASYAQDLDPTVIVDRAYEGKLIEVHKPALEMSVPDSLMRFDLDFDYSVFDRPYKGSYEFNPYLLSMKPSVASDRPGRLYVRAGAGYGLHPEADIVWSPALSKKGNAFRMNVYAHHRSYVGDYHKIDRILSDINSGPDVNNIVDRSGNRVWSGYDSRTEAGVDVGYDWARGQLGLDASYRGLHQQDFRWVRGYNAMDLDFRAASKDGARFKYSLDAGYIAAVDNSSGTDGMYSRLNEQVLDLSAAVGSRFNDKDFVLEADMSTALYSDLVDASATVVAVTPKYIYERAALYASLGVRFDKAFYAEYFHVFQGLRKQQVIYPDVDVRLKLVPEYLSACLKLGGGSGLLSYSDIIERNPYFKAASVHDLYFLYPSGRCDMGVETERISAVAGLEGRIGGSFGYDLYGGYVNYAAGMLDFMAFEAVYYSALRQDFVPYEKLFAALDMRWRIDRFAADASVVFNHVGGSAFDASDPSKVFLYLAPAALEGDISLEYNYSRRIYAGIDCSFRTARSNALDSIRIPGYVDLGLSAEYVTSRGLSFWARGGNLLGMTIQRVPLYAEKGPYFTLGFSLKL